MFPCLLSQMKILCLRKHKVVKREELICSYFYYLGAGKLGRASFAVSFKEH